MIREITISKGSNFCMGDNSHDLQDQKLEFRFKMDESAIYRSGTWANQQDINKLTGFSSCGHFHHQNSARFGWNWMPNWYYTIPDLEKNWKTVSPDLDITDGKMQIWAYNYVDGVRQSQMLGYYELDTWAIGAVRRRQGKYIFHYGDYEPQIKVRNKIIMPASDCENMEGYMLNPYFGGDERAKQKITIWLEYR
jgi:hypothetical protein